MRKAPVIDRGFFISISIVRLIMATERRAEASGDLDGAADPCFGREDLLVEWSRDDGFGGLENFERLAGVLLGGRL